MQPLPYYSPVNPIYSFKDSFQAGFDVIMMAIGGLMGFVGPILILVLTLVAVYYIYKRMAK